jgi:hypothetical protein
MVKKEIFAIMFKDKNANRSPRNSSIELYRIIATFAVLIVHFNGWFLGDWPLPAYDISNPTLFRTGQMIISAAVIICVNMFVIISGYFGIRLKLSSILKLIIYLALIYVPLYIVKCVSDHEFVLTDFIERCLVISYAGYFIQCYFMLMILSPVINAFIDKYGRDCLKWVLLFGGLEFWFDCIMEVEELGYNRGYSVIHFVLMYMIARCIKLYEDDIKRIKPWVWVFGYLLSTIVIIFSFVAGVKWCWNYSSPIVVFSSVCTFLPFLYKTFHNKVVNWIASGTLAVYIIHVTNRAKTILETVDRNLLDTKSYPMYLILISVVIFITFIVSALYGIVCNYISSRVTKGNDKRTKYVLSFE